jgi:AcrR family transcriptional regulator
VSGGSGDTGGAGVAPGRKRDASRDGDLCQAALELLAEAGYDRLTVDAVAARAGAGKATVYRRWPSKAELVVDAMGRMKGFPEEVDTGSLRGDLEVMTCQFGGGDPFQTAVTAGLVSALVHDGDLRAAFAEQFIAPRKARLRGVFERAVARGEIPAQPDFELLTGVLPAMAFHRMITTGLTPDADFALAVIDRIVLPLAQHPGPIDGSPTSDFAQTRPGS